MRLKHIELAGFKSFGSRTTIAVGPGLTAIVGPNGSGKSNLADAVRWVLGEQSTKLLRLSGNQDIIFAGTSRKPRASMAEVSLLFDNTLGKMPMDSAEVQISRKLYRSGDSEYLLNGNRIRLHELNELLAEAGFGQNSYAVIGQGAIEKMLLATPAEHKTLFEEASGARQFELRRNRHIKKLEQTRQNIVALRGFIAELEPKYNTLKKQAESQAKKEELRTKLVQYKSRRMAGNIFDRKQELKDLQPEFESGQKSILILQKELDDLREKRKVQENRLNQEREQQRVTFDRIQALNALRDSRRDRISLLKAELDAVARIEAMADSVSATDKDQPAQESSKDIGAKLARALKNMKVLQASIEQYDKKIHSVQAEINAITTRLVSLRRTLQRGKKAQYLNHALGLLNLLAHQDNVVRMSKQDRDLALHKMRRMLKLALDDNSEKIAYELSQLQTKITHQMALREELVEARNKHIIRLRGVELDIVALEEAQRKVQDRQSGLLKQDTQDMLDIDRSQHKAELKELNTELQNIDAEIKRLQGAISKGLEPEQPVHELDVSIEHHVAELSRHNLLVQELKDSIEQAERALAKLENDYRKQFKSSPPKRKPPVIPTDHEIALLEAQVLTLAESGSGVMNELHEAEAKLKGLLAQERDLQSASSDLETLISQAEKQIRSHFAIGLKSMSEKFEEFFVELFGGGSAEVVLDWPNDSEYGIEFRVSLPGKRVQQLATLSGGERALGAIALIAAIMAVNPSPFVVLDEVDAALDDTNAGKYCNLLRRLTKNTQGIVITHNHTTMQAANQIIGITSAADGGAIAVSGYAELMPEGVV